MGIDRCISSQYITDILLIIQTAAQGTRRECIKYNITIPRQPHQQRNDHEGCTSGCTDWMTIYIHKCKYTVCASTYIKYVKDYLTTEYGGWVSVKNNLILT